ncbi:hypothetical protein EUX98_g1071 [Antrodiella citrinella]|uniref:Uncharacterized protein n=1 Tax=Antrodiella citrinella TaxID=2447956 RepID=A0A4S4N2F4_9APHY|nr:hypothetical protein EUX98_g1071 [Antrodiella citrinella]
MQTKEPVVHAQHLKQPSNSSAYTKRMSVIPVNPLPPPPRRKNSETNTIASTVPAKSSTSRERPGLLSRPPGSFDPQKIMQRRSIMKKPSFLEIDDEMSNDEMENLVDVSLEQIAASPPMESSFLDLDRSSFDSWRSDDDPGMF